VTTLIITLVVGVAAVVYFIRIGRQLEKSGSYRTALGIHGKINKVRDEINKKRNDKIKRLDDDPRSVFTPDD
jgi:hypothetical protein